MRFGSSAPNLKAPLRLYYEGLSSIHREEQRNTELFLESLSKPKPVKPSPYKYC